MTLYSSWVHGNNVCLERWGATSLPMTKGNITEILRTGSQWMSGHVYLGPFAAAVCFHTGWGARFSVYDTGEENKEKSGSFWCHYPIPTPVIESGARIAADTVLVNWESSDLPDLYIASVHVWDGNRKIFADDNPPLVPCNGGINGQISDPSVIPDLSRVYRGTINSQPVYFGAGVSLLIRANSAREDFLDIRGVGIDFRLVEPPSRSPTPP